MRRKSTVSNSDRARITPRKSTVSNSDRARITPPPPRKKMRRKSTVSNSDRARITPPPPPIAGEDEVSDRNSEIDRVSELPESVIHRIFDLMRCSRAVARTQILSKNWRRLFNSYPAFDFDQRWFYPRWKSTRTRRDNERRERKRVERFNEGVERSVATRLDRIERADRFKLYAEWNSDRQLRAGWIRAAVAKNVKELDLTLVTLRTDELPLDLTQSSSLTRLRISGDPLRSLAAMKMCNLRGISIEHVRFFDVESIRKIEENCPLLEDLRLVNCMKLTHLQISSLNKLKTVEVQSCWALELIEIEAPNLETVLLHNIRQICRIDLTKCSENLRNFTMKAYNMTDSELEGCISMFPLLEKLELGHCTRLKKPKICSLTLKSLALIQCSNLDRVKVDAPNLHSFRYKGRVMPFPFVHAPNLSEVKFSFDPYSRRSNAKYQNFFWNFDGSELQLKLVVYTKKSMMIFEDPRKADLSQLDDSEMEFNTSSSKIFTIFEDWLRESHGKSLIVVTSNDELLKSINSLIIERDKSPSCCESDSDKCWRHYIKGVKVATSVAAEKTSYDLRWEPRKTKKSISGKKKFSRYSKILKILLLERGKNFDHS